MKRDRMLTITSLLSIVLLSFHLAQDAVRATPGTWPAAQGNLTAIAILVAYLCGTLLLTGRVGYTIKLLGGLLAVGMPIIHLTAPRFGLVARPDQLLFMWTLIALGVLGVFAVILSTLGLVRPAGRSTSIE